MKFRWQSDEVHVGTATKQYRLYIYSDGSHETLSQRACGFLKCWRNSPIATGLKCPSIERDPQDHCPEMCFLHCHKALFNCCTIHSETQWKGLKSKCWTTGSVFGIICWSPDNKDQEDGNYDSQEVVRSVGNGLSVYYTHVRQSNPPYLSSITKAVAEAGLNIPMELGELLPKERRRYD